MRKNLEFSISFEILDEEFELKCSMSPIIPGRISGPPENCYPPEGGEIELLKVFDGKGNERPAIMRMIYEDEEVQSKLWDRASIASADAAYDEGPDEPDNERDLE